MMNRIQQKIVCCTALLCLTSPFNSVHQVKAESPSIFNTLNTTAQTIQKKHEEFLKNIDYLTNNPLKNTLINHEKNTQENINTWLNSRRPSIENIAKDIESYDNNFDYKYQRILNIVQNSKENTLVLLQDMQNDMKTLQNKVHSEVASLNQLRENLTSNSRSIKNDYIEITAKKDGEYAEIKVLTTTLTQLTEEHTRLENIRKNSRPSFSLQSKISDIEKKIQDIREQIKSFEFEVSVLDTLNRDITSFCENVDKTIDILNSYTRNWDVLNAKIESVIKNIKSSQKINNEFFIEDMKIVRKSWKNVLNFTKQQIKFSVTKAYTQVPADGNYKIVSALDPNKVLDFDYATNNHAKLWYYGYVENQQWALHYVENREAYQIISKKDPSKVLAWNQHPSARGKDNEVFVTEKNTLNELFSGRLQDDHLWLLEDAGNGYFFIKNLANSNMVLDIYGFKKDNGTIIGIHTKTGGNNQKFKFDKY